MRRTENEITFNYNAARSLQKHEELFLKNKNF